MAVAGVGGAELLRGADVSRLLSICPFVIDQCLIVHGIVTERERERTKSKHNRFFRFFPILFSLFLLSLIIQFILRLTPSHLRLFMC